MYELYNGSERLMGALERRMDDAEFIQALSNLLYYCEGQLQQDIKALRDRLDQAQK